MQKRAKVVLLFTLVLVGCALFFSGQVEAVCTGGSFSEVTFDGGTVKVTFDPCTGEVLDILFRQADGTYAPGYTKTLYICPENPTAGGFPGDCQLVTNVGPGTGCTCYGSPPCFTIGQRTTCYGP
jgi:hypothetical protein